MSKLVKVHRLGKVTRGIRPSEEQKKYLISYLEDNIYFAHDKFPSADGAKHREIQWNDLADQLNAMGGAFKDSRKWRKFLTDWRLNVREKYAVIKHSKNKRGRFIKPLTEVEERLLKIMSSRTTDENTVIGEIEVELEEIKFTPVQNIQQQDVQQQNFKQEQKLIQQEEIDFEPTTSSTSDQQHSLKRNRSKTKHINIEHFFKLEKHKVDLEKEKVKLKRKELEIRKQELRIRKINLKEKLVIKKKLDEILRILKNE